MYNTNATTAKSLKTSAGIRRRPKVSRLKRLVTEAVSSEPLRGMVLRDIYCYVQQHSSEYTNSDVVWHKNVRFLLSSNKYFVKSSERNPNGSGFYWKFDNRIFQQYQNKTETRRTKARIPVNTQNELSETKSNDQRRSSVSSPPYYRPMNSEPMLIEQKDFKIRQKSHDSTSYPLVNASDIQSSSYPSAESGYPWPHGSFNAWNTSHGCRQDSSRRYESSSLEQYYRPACPISSGNTSYDQRFSLPSVCPELAIFQRESQFSFDSSSVGQRLSQLSHQYAPSQLQGMCRGNYDSQVSDTTSCPFSAYDAVATAPLHSTHADCAFQFGPSLYAQSMNVYISQGPLDSSGRMISRSVRNDTESSFGDQSTHQAWPYSGNQYNEIMQFADSFETNGGY